MFGMDFSWGEGLLNVWDAVAKDIELGGKVDNNNKCCIQFLGKEILISMLPFINHFLYIYLFISISSKKNW